jgi:hypothetical protein
MMYLFTPQRNASSYVISEQRRAQIIGRAVRRGKGWEFRPRRGSVLTATDLSTVSRFIRLSEDRKAATGEPFPA